jgi:hypothetical protein
MNAKKTVFPILLTSINTNTFDGTYKIINTNGLPEPCFMLRLTNNSDRDATVSFNGTADNDFLMMRNSIQIYTSSEPHLSCFRRGIKIYVKGLAGGTGSIYLSGYYRPEE